MDENWKTKILSKLQYLNIEIFIHFYVIKEEVFDAIPF